MPIFSTIIVLAGFTAIAHPITTKAPLFVKSYLPHV